MQLLILFALHLIQPLSTLEECVYYVRPSTSSSCPGQPCLTLDEYSKQQHSYFTSGATFHFIAGNYSLNFTIYIEDADHITFSGPRSTVVAVGNLPLVCCNNVTNFIIQGLTITSPLTGNKKTPVFSFYSSKDILFKELAYLGSFSHQIVVFNHSTAIIEDSLFEGNTGFYNGSIFAEESIITLTGCTFSGNKATGYGGAIYALNSSVLLQGVNNFQQNFAQLQGGAIFLQGSVLSFNGAHSIFQSTLDSIVVKAEVGGDTNHEATAKDALFFSNNSASKYGGAICCHCGKLELAGESHFTSNSINTNLSQDCTDNFSYQGGAVFAKECDFTISGRASFSSNHAGQGGAVSVESSTMIFSGGPIEFVSNRAVTRGGGLMLNKVKATITTKILSVKNNYVTDYGGGIFFEYTNLSISNGLTVVGNVVEWEGGGIFSQNSNYSINSGTFHNNKAKGAGAAIFVLSSNACHQNITVTENSANAVRILQTNSIFTGRSIFSRNSGSNGFQKGGGIFIEESSVHFEGNAVFEYNHVTEEGGAIYALYKSSIFFEGNVMFTNNTAIYNGGAIAMISASLILTGNITFTFNSATLGGAMYFEDGATITLKQNTNLILSHNSATEYGGGIYHMDSITHTQCNFIMKSSLVNFTLPTCFLQIVFFSYINYTYTIQSDFNSAGKNGDFLYGGLIDKCQINYPHTKGRLYYWDVLYSILNNVNILIFHQPENFNKVITSQPYMLCFCESITDYNCTKSASKTTYRGRKFNVSLIAVAQAFSIVSASVQTETSSTMRLQPDQSSQHLAQNCTSLQYTLYSANQQDSLTLYLNDGGCHNIGLARAVIHVTFLKCPDAFNLSGDQCVCEDRLRNYGAECIITDEDFYIKRTLISHLFWVNALYNFSDNSSRQYEGLILYKKCPSDYCRLGEVFISLDNQDHQCAFNRSGLLCGGCATNHSLMLGSSRCEVCSNTYLFLLIPFAAAGIALVIFLSLLRLTVATGMINIIIFYANILQASKYILLPSLSTNTNILAIFIAWMNLDYGFQTCFYDGFTAYVQTWLQFAFPVYVWFLISVIIVTSRYSSTVTKLIGSNPVAVLATLLLMSYAKVLKAIIEIYSYVKLDYPQNLTTVWLKDANVPYLVSKHLVLAVVATLFVAFFFLPYTLLLLVGYKLYRFSSNKYMRWLNSIKPLLDAYYAPYENHTRYWTGLLLLVRCAFYFVFIEVSFGNSARSLLSIIVVITALLALAWISGRVYSSFYLNVLEGLMYLNLMALSATVSSGFHSTQLEKSLVWIMFAVTLIIIVYHFHLFYIAKSSVWLNITAKVTANLDRLKSHSTSSQTTPLLHPSDLSSHDPNKICSTPKMDYREPLLTERLSA